MAFNEDDRERLVRIEVNMNDMKPQVKANTRFRWIASGIVTFAITAFSIFKGLS